MGQYKKQAIYLVEKQERRHRIVKRLLYAWILVMFVTWFFHYI